MITDFDGTIAPIVLAPEAARPLSEAVEVLHLLAERYACVAVVSGRPVSFLVEHLGIGGHRSALRAVGLYGLEESDSDGNEIVDPGLAGWREVVAEAADDAARQVPDGVLVERKGLSVALHWRPASDAAGADSVVLAAALAERYGLEIRPGRKAVELAPPVGIDKGSVVERLCEGLTGALYAGDDVGDLPAFTALDRLADDGTTSVCKVAVSSSEAPPELLDAADIRVEGPAGVVELLRALADADAAGCRSA